MAVPAKNNPSSIAMALAGKSHRVDIPLPSAPEPAGSYASVAAAASRRSASGSQGVDLPTPPASISPSLPPQAYQHHQQALLGVVSPPSPPSHHGVEYDFDLQDAVDHARAQDTASHPKRREAAAAKLSPAGEGTPALNAHALAAYESSAALTACTLARNHLPQILLEHGPLAIRHVMGFLTQEVPGFSSIAATKARRLVVNALEGGYNPDISFEKVGWGRWDAHRPDGSDRVRQRTAGRELSGLPRYDGKEPNDAGRIRSIEARYPSYPSQMPMSSLRIPHRPASGKGEGKGKRRKSSSGALQQENSISPDLGPFELETDADRMSLDGEEAGSGGGSSTTNPDDVDREDDSDDVTDEEDWASIGAAALKQASYSNSYGAGGGSRMLSAYSPRLTPSLMTLSHRTRRDSGNHNPNHVGIHKATGGGIRKSSLAKSAPSPLARPAAGLRTVSELALHQMNECSDDNERQAVAALMSLGAI